MAENFIRSPRTAPAAVVDSTSGGPWEGKKSQDVVHNLEIMMKHKKDGALMNVVPAAILTFLHPTKVDKHAVYYNTNTRIRIA